MNVGLGLDTTHTHCHWTLAPRLGRQKLGLELVQFLPDLLLQFFPSPGPSNFHVKEHQHLLEVATGLT